MHENDHANINNNDGCSLEDRDKILRNELISQSIELIPLR